MIILLAEYLFWFLVSLVVFIYFVYPIAIFLIAFFFKKKLKKECITPSISFIVSVHNEEDVIGKKVKNTLALDYPEDKLEIIFALDGCTDKTKDILEEYANKGIKIFDKKEREGKVKTLNRAVSRIQSEIVVFSDANSIYREDSLKKLMRWFSDISVGCVCGRLKYVDSDTTSVGKGENLYWKYESFIKMQESKLGKLLITNGSIQALRRTAYPYPDPDVADDFSIPILIQANGYRAIYEPEAVATEIATQSVKEEFAQKVRIVTQGFQGTVRLAHNVMKLGVLGVFEFLFHKLLRWLAFLFLIGIFLATAILIKNPFYYYMLIAQIVFYSFSFAGFLLRNKCKVKIFYIPFYFCLVNFASAVALLNFFKGNQTRTWDKAHSTRKQEVEGECGCNTR